MCIHLELSEASTDMPQDEKALLIEELNSNLTRVINDLLKILFAITYESLVHR